MRRLSVTALCAVGFASLVACGPATLAAAPHRSANASPTTTSAAPSTPQLFAAKAFGDATTVDPCSVVDVAKLPASLHPTLDAEDLPFDTCEVDLRLPGGKESQISVGPLEQGAGHSGRTVGVLTDGMALYEDAEPPQGYCGTQLVFVDSYVLDMEAGPVTGSPSACAIAELAGRDVAATLVAGGLRHRGYPSGSLGSIDPCGLSPVGALTAAGLPDAEATEFPEQHECSWTTSNLSVDSVSLAFLASQTPVVADPSTDRVVSIAGRSTLLSDDQADQVCYLDTAVRPYAGGHGLREIAELTVTTEGGDTALACHLARTVGAALWAKLPRH